MAEFVTVMKERKRICEYNKKAFNCTNCELSSTKNGSSLTCYVYIARFSEEAEKIIMDWAVEHPAETMKEHFFKLFPNAPRNAKGAPEGCNRNLGWSTLEECVKYEDCNECWNRPYKEKNAPEGE